jgi:hypothetical protein
MSMGLCMMVISCVTLHMSMSLTTRLITAVLQMLSQLVVGLMGCGEVVVFG